MTLISSLDKAGTLVDLPSIPAARKAHMKPCGDRMKKK
jgi:hypothetical protein